MARKTLLNPQVWQNPKLWTVEQFVRDNRDSPGGWSLQEMEAAAMECAEIMQRSETEAERNFWFARGMLWLARVEYWLSLDA